jgi:polyhydroxyalkanoate synthesis regulator phasin
VKGATVGGTAFKYALIIYQRLGSEEFMIETLAPEVHSCLTGTPVAKKPAKDDELTQALRLMESEAYNFASNYINDAGVRVNYNRKINEMSAEIKKVVDAGEMTVEEGAETANRLRNGIMEESRAQTSSIGRAQVEAEKSTGRSLETLLEKYSADKFNQRKFIELTLNEKREVFAEIIKSSGRPSPKYTAKIPKLRLLGRACLVATVSISAFNIWRAQNKIKAGMREGLVFGGGALGGALAGASTGLVCGPGAPACAVVLFVVGGLAGAYIADTAGDHYDREIEEIAAWLD